MAKFDKKVGDRITVLASKFLGVPAIGSTIREVHNDCYIVYVDGDDPEWTGPIDHDGCILDDCPTDAFGNLALTRME